ncbi:hypothetical protein AKJ16_DCAP23490 [Drosera capensis]
MTYPLPLRLLLPAACSSSSRRSSLLTPPSRLPSSPSRPKATPVLHDIPISKPLSRAQQIRAAPSQGLYQFAHTGCRIQAPDANNSVVQVSMKHFAKCLQFHLAKRDDSAYYGVGSDGGSFTVVFQFFLPGTRQTDKSISFGVWFHLMLKYSTRTACES